MANDTMHNLSRKRKSRAPPVQTQPLTAASSGLNSLAEGSIGAERDVTVDEQGNTLSNRRFSQGLVQNDTMHNLARSKRKTKKMESTALGGIYE